VPFVNTSWLNARHGHRVMLNTTRNIWSAAHLSALGHAGIAELLTTLLLNNCTAAFTLPRSPGYAQREYFCRIGASLGDLRVDADAVATKSHRASSGGTTAAVAPSGGDRHTSASVSRDGWYMDIPPDGRTPGLVTTSPNTTLTMRLPIPSSGRFLSLGYECSYRHDGVAAVTCGGACSCTPFKFHAHTRKKYTYLQRTRPTWITPSAAATEGFWDAERSLRDPSAAWCELRVATTHVSTGRVMLKAVTISTPRS